ncbi:MAG TPA: N-acetylmuramoyl-L-alanine amidase [Bacillales bacterium]|nr:N-acetylmuramoyl-L-alanine amidase [Bacillales bacterium]
MGALTGYKIFIDAGHGGSDAGATYGTLYEKNLTLDIANRLKTHLEAKGATTQMSRTGDTNPTLSTCTSASNSFGADIFVSVHNNAGGGTGVETWVHDNSSSTTNSLAGYVNNKLASYLSASNRGVKKAPSQRGENIYVLDPVNIKAWAILSEVLFIDNSTDRAKLQNSTYLQKAAEAISDGISQFVLTLPPK